MKHTTKTQDGAAVFSMDEGGIVVLEISRPGEKAARVRLHPAEVDAIQWALMHQAKFADRQAQAAAVMVATRGDHIVSAIVG